MLGGMPDPGEPGLAPSRLARVTVEVAFPDGRVVHHTVEHALDEYIRGYGQGIDALVEFAAHEAKARLRNTAEQSS